VNQDCVIWADDIAPVETLLAKLAEAGWALGQALAIINLLLHDNTAPTTRRIATNFLNDQRQALS